MRSALGLLLAGFLALNSGVHTAPVSLRAAEPPTGGVVPNVATPPKAEPLKAEPPKSPDKDKKGEAAPPPAGATPPLPVADGLKLPADATVDPKELYVTLIADTKGEDVNWIVVASVPVKYTPLAKTIVVGVPPGAVIHVYAYATVEGKATAPARTVITVKPGAVPPIPVPPDVGANPAKVYVTVVEDFNARGDNPWLAELINDKAFRASLAAEGVNFRVMDVKDPEYARAKLAPYTDAAGGMPTLIVQDGAGKVFSPQKCPKTTAAALDAIRAAAAKAREE